MKRQRTKISPGIKKKGKRILATVLAVVLVSPYGDYKMPATVKADAPEQTLESTALEAVSETAVPEIKVADAIEGTEAAAPETEDQEPEKQPAEDPTGPETPQTEQIETESNVMEETCICTEPCMEETVNMDCPMCSGENGDWKVCKGKVVFTEEPGEQESCICTISCSESHINADCPICSVENADLSVCKGESPQASVTMDGITTEYANLLEALNAANEKNATVTMLQDGTGETSKDYFWTMTGGNVTLDMNGHTLICEGFVIEDNSSKGMLTITGNGNFQSTGQGVNVISGKCTIENGTFSLTGLVKSFLIGNETNGLLTIKGGTFKSSSVELLGPSSSVESSSAISGGTFDELNLYSGINLKITGGKFGKINGGDTSCSTYIADGYTLYDYANNQWVTEPEKLSAVSIENVEVKRIPVSISAQPQDKTVYYSQWTEKLEVTAQTVDGAGPVSYQWYRVGTGADGGDEAISGAAEAQFRIPGDLDAGTHNFYCIATCDGYPAKSNTAAVTVLQSGIDLGEIKTYLKRDDVIPKEQTIFTGEQTIMVTVTPKTTGKAPAVMARTAAAEPAAGQMALYDEKGNQIGPAVDASVSGAYWMNVNSTELGVGVHVLTVKYVGGPNVVSAEGTVEVTVVPAARIDSQEYFTLEAAWADAKKNSSEESPVTVTLLADVEVSSELTVESEEHIILTSEPDKNYTVSSTINGPQKGTIRMSGGIFELLGGTVKSPGNGYGIFLLGGSAFLRGGSITGMHGIYLEEYKAAARVEIFSGFVMRVSSDGIEAQIGGELIINGGQMEAGSTCVHAKNGVTVRISGGIIKSYFNGHGLDVSGNSSALVELSGGTFTGSDSSPSISVSNTSNVKSILAEGKAYYRGGDTTGELITEGLDGTKLLETVTVGDCTHSVKEWTDLQDGTHTGVCTACGSTIVAAHTWDSSHSKCPDCQIAFAASVESNGEEALFAAIEQAWAYAKKNSSEENGATVTLLADAEVSEGLTVEAGEHIILTCPEGVEYTLFSSIKISGGTFVLTGGTVSHDNKDATIDITGGRALLKGGKVTGMRGVRIPQDAANGAEMEIDGDCVIIGDEGVLIRSGTARIKGGQISGTGKGNAGFVVYGTGNAKISGGSIQGKFCGLEMRGKGVVTLSGGTFRGYYGIESKQQPVKNFLEKGKAYYQGEDTAGELITEGLEGTWLPKTVTVGDCIHWIGSGSDNGDGTHTGACAVCGQEVIKSHNMAGWTDQEDGTHARACEVCGYTEKHPHSMTVWKDQKDGTHSRSCSDCEYTETAEHIWDRNHPQCPDCQLTAVVLVEIKGTDTLFSSMAEAWEYAKENSLETSPATVMLLADVTISESLYVNEGESLILTSANGMEYSLDVINNYADGIVVQGGTFEMTGGSVSHNLTAISIVGGKVVIRGGKVTGGLTGLAMQGGNAMIDGGTITGEQYGIAVFENSASVLLSGGCFTGKGYGSIVQNCELSLNSFLAEGCYYYDETGNKVIPADNAFMLSKKTVFVKNPDVVSYTISIPQTAIAGGEPVNIGINQEQTFNLNGGTVSVSVSGGIDESGKLTLTDKANTANTVTSALYVQKPGETEEQPITSYENGVFASFTKAGDPAAALSFKEPTEINIPIGRYEGNVTFSIDYTEAQQ